MQTVAVHDQSVDNNWDAVAKAVKHERLARRWSIRDACAVAGVSTTTWINAEKGMQLAPLTLTAISQAFDWPDGATDRLLAGESLESPQPTASTDDESWDDLKSSLSEEGRAAVRAIIEQLRAKRY